MTVRMIDGRVRWVCQNCSVEELAPPPGPTSTRMHQCVGLRGLLAPLLVEGMRAKVEVREREDYVGREHVQLDPERGRPVMSVVTTRDDGQDTIVFAPVATIAVDI